MKQRAKLEFYVERNNELLGAFAASLTATQEGNKIL
jgi:hypothetical protein